MQNLQQFNLRAIGKLNARSNTTIPNVIISVDYGLKSSPHIVQCRGRVRFHFPSFMKVRCTSMRERSECASSFSITFVRVQKGSQIARLAAPCVGGLHSFKVDAPDAIAAASPVPGLVFASSKNRSAGDTPGHLVEAKKPPKTLYHALKIRQWNFPHLIWAYLPHYLHPVKDVSGSTHPMFLNRCPPR